MAPKQFFPRVREAREALAQKAMDLLDQHLQTIEKAAKSGQYKVAIEAQQWLIEHMPADVEGNTLIDTTVDTQKQIDSGPKGPAIQIGIAIAPQPKAELPPANVKVIDVTPNEDSN